MPIRTLKSVLLELEAGLRDGSIVLDLPKQEPHPDTPIVQQYRTDLAQAVKDYDKKTLCEYLNNSAKALHSMSAEDRNVIWPLYLQVGNEAGFDRDQKTRKFIFVPADSVVVKQYEIRLSRCGSLAVLNVIATDGRGLPQAERAVVWPMIVEFATKKSVVWNEEKAEFDTPRVDKSGNESA
jgi:hypothetical protein